MDAFIREIRVALRTLAREKGFAAAMVLTLAVCVGANSAMFAIVNSVLLKPLPFHESESIVKISNRYPKAGVGGEGQSGGGDYADRKRGVTAVEEHAMYTTADRAIEWNGSPEQMRVMEATPSLFRVLRAQPRLGRTFTDAEGQQGSSDRVVLTYGLWQQLFGGSEDAVGKKLRINGAPMTIVGVMPASFTFMDPDVRLWQSLAFSPEELKSHHSNNWINVGRLRSGATIAQAQSQVDAVNAANLDAEPELKPVILSVGFHSTVNRLQDEMVKSVKPALLLLWGGAIFLALIGAVNLAGLTVARMHVRRREFATRLAIGAGRGRVAAQLLVENALLALVGAAFGMLLGNAALNGFANFGLDRLPRANEISVDGIAGAYALAVALITAACATGASFLQFFAAPLNSLLREDSRGGTASRNAGLLRSGLVVVQVACAFVLLAGAGLLIASFDRLLKVDPGYRTAGLQTVSLTLPDSRYKGSAEIRAFTHRALEALRALPAVESVGATSSIPFGSNHSDSVIIPEGYALKPGDSVISPTRIEVSPEYLQTMGARLVSGRWLDNRDSADTNRTAIIDETLARKFWPGQDAVGRRFFLPSDAKDLMKVDEKTVWITVAGVVKPMAHSNLAGDVNTSGAYYFPLDQAPRRFLTFVVRANTAQSSVTGSIRETLRSIDSQLALFDVRTMQERVDRSLAGRKGAMMLAISFGSTAVFLACLGVYGVLVYLVAQRKREIGIRMALGSTRGGIARLILNEGLGVTAIGIAIGLAGTFGMRKLIAGQLFGVAALDPLVLIPAVALFTAVALIACAIPVRRATLVDPASVLNQ